MSSKGNELMFGMGIRWIRKFNVDSLEIVAKMCYDSCATEIDAFFVSKSYNVIIELVASPKSAFSVARNVPRVEATFILNAENRLYAWTAQAAFRMTTMRIAMSAIVAESTLMVNPQATQLNGGVV